MSFFCITNATYGPPKKKILIVDLIRYEKQSKKTPYFKYIITKVCKCTKKKEKNAEVFNKMQ